MRWNEVGVRDLCAVFVAVALALAGAGAAVAQTGTRTTTTTTTTTTGPSGFYEVTVNLRTSSFDQRLDFDRPIRISGDLPAGADNLSVSYAASPQALKFVGSGKECAVQRTKDGTDVPLLPPTGPIQARVDTSDKKFFVVTPRLPPNQYFIFCFSYDAPVSEAVATAFTERARDVLDRRLAVADSAALNEAEVRDICGALMDTLDRATGGDILDPNGFFTPELCSSSMLQGEFNPLIVDVLEPQVDVKIQRDGDPALGVDGFRDRQLAFRRKLDQIRENKALTALVAVLRAEAATDANLRGWLDKPANVAALAITELDPDRASRTALGQNLESSDQASLLTADESKEVSSFEANYRQTQGALVALRKLITELFVEPVAQRPVDLSTAVDDGIRQQLVTLAGDQEVIRKAGSDAARLAGLVATIGQNLDARATALEKLAEHAKIVARGVKVADGSSTIPYDTLQGVYISGDAGLVYAPEIDEVVSYVGTNIYLRPINKDVPLNQVSSFRHRFAITLGLTVQGIDDTENGVVQTRDNLFGDQSLLIGAGFRVNRVLRIGAGALIFREKDPNPLIDDLSVTASPYLTLSFDLNVARAFSGGLGGLFGAGN